MTSAARRYAPAMIVAVPLAGFSLQGDDRRSLYHAANLIASDPLEALGQAAPGAVSPAARGSLGPLGRIVEGLQHALAFEAAEAAGLAPHVVQGVVRVAMVAVLAVAAAAMVAAVMRSAGAHSASEPVTALFPLVLAAVLVAGGPGGPVTRSPVVSIGAVALVLALALLVARDQDMEARLVRWPELGVVGLLGAAAAVTHGLVGVAPAAAGGLVLARAAAAGQAPAALLRTASLRRWAALSVGVVAAVVVERTATEGRCDEFFCFAGSGLSLSGSAAGLTARRMLTGAPPAGWAHNAGLLEQAGLSFRVLDFASNSLLAVLAVVIAALAVRHGMAAVRGAADGGGPAGRIRASACLAVLGGAVAAPPALLAGLTSRLQSADLSVGEAWTDTLLVQVGWSLVIAAAVGASVSAAAGALRSLPRRKVAAGVVAVVLGLAVVATLLANGRLAYIDRRSPLPAVVSEISEFTVVVQSSDAANALRCGLVDDYTRIGPDPGDWAGGPQLRAELDGLMLQRQGWPFCDPARPVS